MKKITITVNLNRIQKCIEDSSTNLIVRNKLHTKYHNRVNKSRIICMTEILIPNLKYYGKNLLKFNNSEQSKVVSKTVQLVNSKQYEINHVILIIPEQQDKTDYKVMRIFNKGFTTSKLKCIAGFNISSK